MYLPQNINYRDPTFQSKLVHLPKFSRRRIEDLKDVAECLIRASLSEKEFKIFQLKSKKEKHAIIRKLEIELQTILKAPRTKIKGKTKAKQKFYKETKVLFRNLVVCSERFDGRQKEVEQMLKSHLNTHEHDDYFLLGLAALKFKKLFGLVDLLAGKKNDKKPGMII